VRPQVLLVGLLLFLISVSLAEKRIVLVIGNGAYVKAGVLQHGFRQATAKAVPELLNQLKARGYRDVHM
jgi:peptidoglycan/xylan/chitin deacetylase (PgdA/CDA1 family)